MGVNSACTVYIVGGSRDFSRVEHFFFNKSKDWTIASKWTLARGAMAEMDFQVAAAIDFYVAIRAAHYIGKPGSNFDQMLCDVRASKSVKMTNTWWKLPSTNCGYLAEATSIRQEFHKSLLLVGKPEYD